MLAEQLYGEVGRPPGWILRTWGRGAEGSAGLGVRVGYVLLLLTGAHPAFGLITTAAAAYVIGYPVGALIHAVGWATASAPLQGPLSPLPVLATATLLVALLVGVPMVLIGKQRSLARVRIDIHASLGATLPERPGGPSRCRNCGAALDTPRGALGVPCVYCRADNLVALPQAWISQIRASEFHHFLRIDAALDAFRRASGQAQEQLWRLVFGLILVFPVVLLSAYVLDKAGFRY